ncbi:MAG TPA: hypothetical protein VGA24_08275, partial [Steroidobacteraceae bacterium]
MRQEMRSTGLLAEREGRPGQDRARQCAACKPRTAVEQHEVERHQGEAGGRMRSWIAAGTRQSVRTITKRLRIRTVAAELCKVPRAVDIRDLFQARNYGGTKGEPKGDIGGAAAIWREPPQAGTRNGDRGCRESDETYEPAAARMNDVDGPPGMCADPCLGRAIVEESVRDPEIEIPGGDSRDRQQESGGPCVLSRSPVHVHDQKLRLV